MSGLGKIDIGFYAGVHCALAVIRARGEDTLFDEVLHSVGEKECIAEARRRGVMRWSGLSNYLRRKKASHDQR